MKLADLDRKIEFVGVPNAKELLRRLIKRGNAGFRIAEYQARCQCDSATLLNLGYAIWENGMLFLNPQVADELKH